MKGWYCSHSPSSSAGCPCGGAPLVTAVVVTPLSPPHQHRNSPTATSPDCRKATRILHTLPAECSVGTSQATVSLSQGTPSWSLFSFPIGNNTVLAQLHRMKMDLRISLFAGQICRATGPSLPPLANSCQHFVVLEGLSAWTPLPTSSSPSYKGSPHLRVGYPRGELYRPWGAARIRTPALPQVNSQVRWKRLP